MLNTNMNEQKTAVHIALRFFLWGLGCLQFSSFSHADTEVVLAPSIDRVFYREFSPQGKTLNTETGFLPGLALTLSKTRNGVSGYVKTYYGASDLNYDGQVQSSGEYQATSRTKKYVLLWGLKWHSLHHQLGLSWGKKNWDRTIESRGTVQELAQQYEWNRGGLSYEYVTADSKTTFEVARLFNGVVNVDLIEQGYGIIPVAMPTGSEMIIGYEHTLPHWLFNTSENWKMGAKLMGHYFPRSDASFRGDIGVIEPENLTVQFRVYFSYLINLND